MPVPAVKFFVITLGVVATGSVGLGAPAAYEYFTSKSEAPVATTEPGVKVGQSAGTTPTTPQSSPIEGGSSQNSDGSPKVENADSDQSQSADTPANK